MACARPILTSHAPRCRCGLQLAVYELQQAAPTPALAAPQIKVPPGELKKLLLHSLPAGTSEEALRRVFAAAGAPAFVSLEGELGRDKKLHAVFAQPGDANEAFKKLPGTLGKDSWGRATKEVGPPLDCTALPPLWLTTLFEPACARWTML